MGMPPAGVTDREWRAARIRAACADISRRMEAGGFAPADVIRSFLAGWCDGSGNVASFLEAGAAPGEEHALGACGEKIVECPQCEQFVERWYLRSLLASPAETKRL